MKPQPLNKKAIVLCLHYGGSSKLGERRVQDFIKWWTSIKTGERQRYCHAELYNPANGLSFSCRGLKRDGRTGTWWADITYSNECRWKFVELPYSWGDDLVPQCNGAITYLWRAMHIENKYQDYSYPAAAFNKHFKGMYCFKCCRAVLNWVPWSTYGNNLDARAKKCGGIVIHDGGNRKSWDKEAATLEVKVGKKNEKRFMQN